MLPNASITPNRNKGNIGEFDDEQESQQSGQSQQEPDSHQESSRNQRFNQRAKLFPNMSKSKEDEQNQQEQEEEQINQIDIFNQTEQSQNEEQQHKRLKALLENMYFQILINFGTIYALFADDIRMLALESSFDLGYNLFLIVCCILFMLEVALSMLVKPGYTLSFFFWLDLISSLTLIIDLTWVSQMISGSGGLGQSSSIARAGRASRIGTKAGRIVRIIRLIRLLRFLKKFNQEKSKKTQQEQNISKDESFTINTKQTLANQFAVSDQLENEHNNLLTERMNQALSSQGKGKQNIPQIQEIDELQQKESRVGKKLAEIITIRVILMVLVLILIVPLFESSYFFDNNKAIELNIEQLKQIIQQPQSTQKDINSYWQLFISLHKNAPLSLISAQCEPINASYERPSSEPFLLRPEEKEDLNIPITSGPYAGQLLSAQIDLRLTTQSTAIIGICRTIFVAFVLSLGSLMISRDINNLALRPIERMIKKVNQIATNPLSSKDQQIVNSKEVNTNETLVIENAITKIGILLALGFGEAGSNIIAKNMAQQGDLNPMLPGKKLFAIFGFCNIRAFSDITDILEEEVMVFVNTVAQVVHSLVDIYQGSANKNIGDAFLLVWKIPENNAEVMKDKTMRILKNRQVKNIADLSLISFLKIIIALNKKKEIINYRYNPALNLKMPNFQVKMGFGLHIGWAIEGAIGNPFSFIINKRHYLSPNVNIASRIESVTKLYGVPILLSNDLINCMSKKATRFCRQIDTVILKGCQKPVSLYTVDCNLQAIQPATNNNFVHLVKNFKDKYEKYNIKKSVFSYFTKQDPEDKANILFLNYDKDLQKLLQHPDNRFREIFDEGYNYYLKGEWQTCLQFLKTAVHLRPYDEPTKVLIRYIRSYYYQSPVSWKGYRVLIEK